MNLNGNKAKLSRKITRFKNWLGIILGSIALYLAVRRIEEPSFIIKSLYYIKSLWFILGIIFFIISRSLRVFIWKNVGNIPLKKGFWTFWAGELLTIVLPLRGGEVGRVLLLSKLSSIDSGIASTLVERISDIISLVIIGSFTLLFYNTDFLSRTRLVYFALFVLIILINIRIGYMLIRRQNLILNISSPKFKPLLNNLLNHIKNISKTIYELPTSTLFKISALAIGIWGFLILSTFFKLYSFSINPPIQMVLLYLILLNLGTSIPSLPASIGIFEYITILVLTKFKIKEELALSFALINHLSNIFVTVIIGIIGWYLWNRISYSSPEIASTGQTSTHAPQSVHNSGSMT